MEPQGVLASLSHEELDQLCDLLATKLGNRDARVPASQAGCRGFESRRPLHSSQWVSLPHAAGRSSPRPARSSLRFSRLHSQDCHGCSTPQSAARLDVSRSRSLQLREVDLHSIERPQILPCNLPVLLETGVVGIVVRHVRFNTK